jgi:hypothetical protein
VIVRDWLFKGAGLVRIIAPLLFTLVVGCSQNSGSSGKCRLNQLIVSPRISAGEIGNVTDSGGACGTVSCVQSQADASCLLYTSQLIAIGMCDVQITRADGSTYTESVSVSVNTSAGECHGGFQPDRDLIVDATDASGQ